MVVTVSVVVVSDGCIIVPEKPKPRIAPTAGPRINSIVPCVTGFVSLLYPLLYASNHFECGRGEKVLREQREQVILKQTKFPN